jgi:signal transduction histidine kinase
MKSFNLQSATPVMYVAAAVIILGSLLYSRYLANQLEEKERHAIELKASAMDLQNVEPNFNNPSPYEQEAQSFVLNIIRKDDEVPWILTNEEFNYISGLNVGIADTLSPEEQQALAEPFIRQFKGEHDPIRVEIAPGVVNYVLYGESRLLTQLRWFPIAQLLVAAAFIGFVLLAFAIAKRNEQNKVWVGLAKETAHQLGTPVSSLMAWIELLKMNLEGQPDDQQYVIEMEQDVKRLEDITERFSKIGSEPELIEISVHEVLEQSANYLKKRMTRKGNITLDVSNQLSPDSKLHINPPLIYWVIENLLKNALDAIQNKKGAIKLHAEEGPNNFTIDVTDTGKGIPKSNFKKVFQPGFTTKKRGWGLGLSLTKRIVEDYHKGKIFVKSSEVGKGTTFRIILPKH